VSQVPDSCAKVDALLLDYAYGELEAGSRAKVGLHLASCERCRGALAEISGTRRLMQTLEPQPAPEDGLESLLDFAQKAAKAQQAPPRRSWRWLVPAFSAGGLALALLLVISGHNRLAPSLSAVPAPQSASTQGQPEAPAAAPAANALASSESLQKAETGNALGSKGLAQPMEDRAGEARKDDAPAVAEGLAGATGAGSAWARSRAVAKEEAKPVSQQRAGKSAGPGSWGALGGSAAKSDAVELERSAASLSARQEASTSSLDGLGEQEAAPEAARPAPSAPSRESFATAAAPVGAGRDKSRAAADDEAQVDGEPLVPQEKRKAEAKKSLAASADSDAPGGALERAREASARGDHAGAVRILRAAVEASPGSPSRASLLLMLARELELSGDADGALAAYARLVDEYPTTASATAAAEARARLQRAAPAERPAAGSGAGWPTGAAASPARAAPAAQDPKAVDSE
jgi:tetratricopeptide (TPR) repeat protein